MTAWESEAPAEPPATRLGRSLLSAARQEPRPPGQGEKRVQVTLVPSSVDARHSQEQFLTSYLIGDAVAVDAGCLGLYRSPAEQARVKHLFLSHTHLDHLASLPTFLANTHTNDGNCLTVYGSDVVLDCLRRDLFNDRLWPDYFRLAAGGPPYLRLVQLHPDQPVECAGLRITPVAVDHLVPTLGFLIEDAAATVVISSDTGPTEAIWERASRAANLKAVFLETTLPNAESWLADLAKHLTPALLAQEVRKLKKPVRYIIVHISPRSRRQVVQELEALGIPTLEIGMFGSTYTF
jgi:ribonuclease BN (tRNA processing enzyme)